MSFFRKLFGGGASAAPPAQVEPVAYKDYLIRPTPYREGGQFQMCGVIEKTSGGETKTHRFVRAEKFGDQAEAEEFTVKKAQQIIDQMGDRIFN